jgi:L-ribulose-5-phosphate 3-epimerase
MGPALQQLSRRAVLTGSAAALAATFSPFAPLLAAQASRRFKIGACDWSLKKRADPSALDLAKQIGLDGVQVDLGTAANDMPLRKPQVQEEYKKAARRTGLGIASLAVCELNASPLTSEPRAVQWLLDALDVGKALGLKIVMAPFFNKGTIDMGQTAEVDRLVEVLKRAAAKAEKLNVVLAPENTLSAEDNKRLLERIGSSAVRVYYDVGNSTDRGRDIFKEIRLLGRLICEFHFKDGRKLLGQGRIDFKQVRKALDDIKYDGWIQIEAAAPHGVLADYTTQAKFLRELFP